MNEIGKRKPGKDTVYVEGRPVCWIGPRREKAPPGCGGCKYSPYSKFSRGEYCERRWELYHNGKEAELREGQGARPEGMNDRHFRYLDELKATGQMRQLDAGVPSLRSAFGLEKREARAFVAHWAETFNQRLEAGKVKA